MRKNHKFELVCLESNHKHTRFALFDPIGANCGQLAIRTEDLIPFAVQNWNGTVDYRGLIPDPLANSNQKPQNQGKKICKNNK